MNNGTGNLLLSVPLYRERIGKEIKNTENGSPYCFFGVFVDITEQKEHTELEKARDEALRKAENALNAINMIPE